MVSNKRIRETVMANHGSDAKALRPADKLANAHNWKHLARWNGEGFYELSTEDTGDCRVRLFFTPQLLDAAEEKRRTRTSFVSSVFSS